MVKIFNKKSIKICNYIIICLLILIFEFGFCNAQFTDSKLTHLQTEGFYFSLCRGIMYAIAIIGLIFINKSAIIDKIEESFTKKIKRRIFLTYLIADSIIMIYFTYIFLIKQEISLIHYSIISLASLILLLSTIYITDSYYTNIIAIFLLSTIFCITVDGYHVLDEKRHFMSAYNVSYGNIKFDKQIVDKQFMEQLPRGTHFTEFTKFFKEKYSFEEGTLPEEGTVDSTPAGYNPIIYVPSAIGILIGRILQGSVADIFLMGRLFNLLAYIVLVLLTIKVIPYKKNLVMIIMSIPIFLCFSATYSIDGIGIGLVSLFIAYCFKLRESDIRFKDLVNLAIIYTLVLTFKSMSYAFVGLLIFLLPIKQLLCKYFKKLIILIFAFIIVNALLFSIQTKINLSDNRYENVDAEKQIENILNHPLILINVMKNHISNTLLNWDWVRDFNAPAYFSTRAENLFIIMAIYYMYVAFKDDSKNFNWKEKTLMIITFFMVYGFTSGILYLGCTPVGALAVGGYQDRYIFPIIALLMCALSNNTLKQNNEDNFLIKTTTVQIMFIYLDIIGTILK